MRKICCGQAICRLQKLLLIPDLDLCPISPAASGRPTAAPPRNTEEKLHRNDESQGKTALAFIYNLLNNCWNASVLRIRSNFLSFTSLRNISTSVHS